MTQPLSLVAELVDRLDANLREAYEERAGIMEFDGGLSRELAECLALLDVLARHPAALLGLTVLQVEEGDAFRHVLTTDPDLVRLGVAVRAVVDLHVVLAEFDGVAVLSRFN